MCGEEEDLCADAVVKAKLRKVLQKKDELAKKGGEVEGEGEGGLENERVAWEQKAEREEARK
jgi:hypothetical protein